MSNHFEELSDSQLEHMLSDLRTAPPRDPEKARMGQARFSQELDELMESLPQGKRAGLVTGMINWWESLRWTNRSSLAGIAVVIVVLAFLFSGAGLTAFAAQDALPGDALYGVKTSLEQARWQITNRAANQAQLQLGFAQRRIDEIAGLIAAGRFSEVALASLEFQQHIDLALQAVARLAETDPSQAAGISSQVTDALQRYAAALSGMIASVPENVRPELEQAVTQLPIDDDGDGEFEFHGSVSSITPDTWVVGGRTIKIQPQTEIQDEVTLGDLVKVHARIQADGTYLAREIERITVNTDGSPQDDLPGGDDDVNRGNNHEGQSVSDDPGSGSSGNGSEDNPGGDEDGSTGDDQNGGNPREDDSGDDDSGGDHGGGGDNGGGSDNGGSDDDAGNGSSEDDPGAGSPGGGGDGDDETGDD
jgi:uncharacterized membrane protein YgcG